MEPDDPAPDDDPTVVGERRSAAPDGDGARTDDAVPDDHVDMPVTDVDATGRVVPIDLRDYVLFSTGSATRVRTLATDVLALDQWCIEPQQSTGVLQYPDGDVIYTVIGGRSWFVTEQGEVGLDPLGSLLVPAGTVHGIDNRGSDPLILVGAMAPPDALAVEEPADPAGLAVRDDAQYGRLGRALSERFGRLLGR